MRPCRLTRMSRAPRVLWAAVLSSLALAFTAAAPSSAHAADEPTKAQEAPRHAPGSGADRLHAAVLELDLTDDQKTKIEDQFTQAQERLVALKSDAGAGPDHRRDVERVYDDLQQEVYALLTDAQKQQVRAKLAPPDDPGAAHGGPIITLRENLRQVGLSDEQKTKIQDIVFDFREKIPGVLKQAGGKGLHDLTNEVRQQIIDLLTPEQKTQLDTIMKSQRGPGGSPGGRPDKPPQASVK